VYLIEINLQQFAVHVFVTLELLCEVPLGYPSEQSELSQESRGIAPQQKGTKRQNNKFSHHASDAFFNWWNLLLRNAHSRIMHQVRQASAVLFVAVIALARRALFAQKVHGKKMRPALGEAGRREPGLGTGRGGDVTGDAYPFSCAQRDDAVAGAARGSPSETQTFGSDCD